MTDKKYNQNKYNKTFKEKNSEKLSKTNICPDCGGQYKYFHKSNHMKTKKHLLGLLKKQHPENDILKSL